MTIVSGRDTDGNVFYGWHELSQLSGWTSTSWSVPSWLEIVSSGVYVAAGMNANLGDES